MNKDILSVLAIAFIVTALAFATVSTDVDAADASGSAGEGLTYTLEDLGNSTYKLTISGTGAMTDYVSVYASEGTKAPWFTDSTIQRSAIVQIELGDGITHIGACAFMETGIESITIPSSVTSIGANAFWKCNLTTEIPALVTDLGATAFYGDFQLTVAEGNTSYKVENGILFSNDGSVLVQAPWDVTQEAATAAMASINKIGDYAFHNCANIGSLTIPGNVRSIGAAAFESSGISGLILSEGLETIGNAAFNNCASLSGDGDGILTIPSSVTEIGKSAFNSYESQTFESQVKSIVISDGVKTIGEFAFGALENVESLSLGDGIVTIGNHAFSGLSKLTGDLTIPSSVTSIGDYAFASCTSLNGTLTIGYTEKSLNLIFGSDTPKFTSLVITGGTSICDSFAYSWGTLTSVTIPDTVTSIGDTAFANCDGLTSLVLPESVKTVGVQAFYGSDNLETADIQGVTSMGESAFHGCDALVSVTISEELGSIPNYAFSDCTSLTHIGTPSAPSDVSIIPGTSIGENAFRYAPLKVVFISENMESIGAGAFNGCRNLYVVYIPSSVTSIGLSAFLSMDAENKNYGNAIIYCADDEVAELIVDDRKDGKSGYGNYLNYTTAVANLKGGKLVPENLSNYTKGSLVYNAEKESSTFMGWVLGDDTEIVTKVSAPSMSGDQILYMRYTTHYNAVWASETEIQAAELSGITQSSTELLISGEELLPLSGTPVVSIDGETATDTTFTVTIEGEKFSSNKTFTSGTDISNVEIEKPSAPGTYTVTITGTGTNGCTYKAEEQWTFTISTPEFKYEKLSVASDSGSFTNQILNASEGFSATYSVDSAIATVSDSGEIKINNTGVATITATIGEYSFGFELTVLPADEAPVDVNSGVISAVEPNPEDETNWETSALEFIDDADTETIKSRMVTLDIVALDGTITSFFVNYDIFGFDSEFDAADYDFFAIHIGINGCEYCYIQREADGFTVSTSGFSPFVFYYLDSEPSVGPEPGTEDPDTPSTPVNPPGDDDESLPPIIRPGGAGSSTSLDDDTITIVACAAAAAVAAIMAVFLIVLYKKD